MEGLPSFVATMSVIPYIYVWEVHSEYVPDLVDLKTFPYAKSVGRVCPGQNAIMSPHSIASTTAYWTHVKDLQIASVALNRKFCAGWILLAETAAIGRQKNGIAPRAD